jgi:hypothetical protein
MGGKGPNFIAKFGRYISIIGASENSEKNISCCTKLHPVIYILMDIINGLAGFSSLFLGNLGRLRISFIIPTLILLKLVVSRD